MKLLRQAQVFYGDELAGYLQEREDGYVFEYDKGELIGLVIVWNGNGR